MSTKSTYTAAEAAEMLGISKQTFTKKAQKPTGTRATGKRGRPAYTWTLEQIREVKKSK